MCGAYIGVDEYLSRLLVLGEKFGDDPLVRAVANDEDGHKRNVWHSAL
jgi:hypothetical protein